jgi:hypothetical protein
MDDGASSTNSIQYYSQRPCHRATSKVEISDDTDATFKAIGKQETRLSQTPAISAVIKANQSYGVSLMLNHPSVL